MIHIAIMNKQWKLIEKILSGEKTIETRWYKTKRLPWNSVFPGETIYFKDAGSPITLRVTVKKVKQYADLTSQKIYKIISENWKSIIVDKQKRALLEDHAIGKKYCILIVVGNVETVSPFEITKKGYGLQSAWITVSSIDLLKK